MDKPVQIKLQDVEVVCVICKRAYKRIRIIDRTRGSSVAGVCPECRNPWGAPPKSWAVKV